MTGIDSTDSNEGKEVQQVESEGNEERVAREKVIDERLEKASKEVKAKNKQQRIQALDRAEKEKELNRIKPDISIVFADGTVYNYKTSLCKERLLDPITGALKSYNVIARILRENDFKHVKFFSVPKLAFFYVPSLGVYKRLVYGDFMIALTKVLISLLRDSFGKGILEGVFREMEVLDANMGYPVVDSQYIVFNDCVFNLDDRKNYSHSPEYFTTHKLDFSYHSDSKIGTPNWDSFLDDFAEGYQDRKALIQAIFNAIIFSKLDFQVIFYVQGPGGTGKSIITNVLKAVTGIESVITTTLAALQADQFELMNLVGKKLVLVNDTTGILKDASIINAYSGGDSLRGRSMHTQGTNEVIGEGFVFMVGNSHLEVEDTGGAIARRLRVFETKKVSTSRINLLKRGRGSKRGKTMWLGPLASELPGIFKWATGADPLEVERIINHPEDNVKSFEQVYSDSKQNIDPMVKWVREEIEPKSGKTYLGCKPDKKHADLLYGTMLYPTHVNFCDRNGESPVSIRKFSGRLLQVLNDEGYKNVKKTRDASSYAIEGIGIREQVKSVEYLLGGPIDVTTTQVTRNSNVNNPNGSIPEKSDSTKFINLHAVDSSLNPNLIPDYVDNLISKTTVRKDINKFVKKMDLSPAAIEKQLQIFMDEWGLEDPTYSFVKHKRDHLNRCANSISVKGIAIYSYRELGGSPRIQPTNYKYAINGMNKSFRNMMFMRIGDFLVSQHQMVILDLDLVSCYTTVLIALFPLKLIRVKRAVEAGSIWEALREEFVRLGKGEYYKKPYVKACFYSVIFGGGIKAMVGSILGSVQKNLGMTPKEFENSDMFNVEKTKANGIAQAFNLLPMVKEFRAMSKEVERNFDNDVFTGPTGHVYPITPESFQGSFANYLQSFESALICESTNETLKKFPEAVLLYHFYDGNTIAVKKDQAKDFIKEIQNQIQITTEKLRLSYPQKIELQASFPEDKTLFDI